MFRATCLATNLLQKTQPIRGELVCYALKMQKGRGTEKLDKHIA